ncbi:MAG: hypothetical protein Q9163_002767 [Psora crenata]
MAGMIEKVKNVLQGEKDTPEAEAANHGHNEYGHNTSHGGSGVTGEGVPGSVAHGSSMSDTQPGILDSTKRGIHGDRDPGTRGGVEHDTHGQHGKHHHDTTSTTDRTVGTGNYTAGPESTGDNTRDTHLVGSGRHTGSGVKSSERDTGFGGGSGGLGGTGTGFSSSGTGYDAGNPTSGSRLSDAERGGSTTAGPHKSDLLNKADPRVDSDRDGSRNMGAAGSGVGAGVTGRTGGQGESLSHTSREHRPGDGYAEDIVHPGPHLSETAKKLDPHMG